MAAHHHRVVGVREELIGGGMSGDELEVLLSENGRDGWRLRAITPVDVEGRVGPGAVDGLLATFDRTYG